ncbi:MAG TPA: DevR family CRISPR-associated autoregulator [Firmicutes bacterium]|nr:DevR family CRISPR-associated autoregulator [Candidatus Fermentithermobacillaceae bacterium]
MGDATKVFEVAFMLRVRWDLHSLNNEGIVGNVTEPRTLVLADGSKTDGISGEMLKHLHSYGVWLADPAESDFCPACRRLQPQRADLPEYRRTFAGLSNVDTVSAAIKNCVLCDLHGFLIQTPPVSRRSTVEFGWAVGIPEVYRDIHTHARHAAAERTAREERGKTRGVQQEEDRSAIDQEEQEEEVSAQMIYHRPTRSGTYAIVSLFQPWRIGLNEIDYQYAIDNASRNKRFHLALQAYKHMFQQTQGAMVSTRLPHVEGMAGVVAISHGNTPVPVLSPLRDDYQKQVEDLARRSSLLNVYPFTSLAELCDIIDETSKLEIYSFRS